MIQPLAITAYTCTNALGKGNNATLSKLTAKETGLTPNDFPTTALSTYIGRVDAIEDSPVDHALSIYDCRNNRLAQIGLEQDHFISHINRVKEQYGSEKIAVIVGTSTSGIGQTEWAYLHRDDKGRLPKSYHYKTTQNIHSLSDFVAKFLDIRGPNYTISTACSSSAKVFASAERLLRTDFVDAVIVGGVDSLCASTLYGFHALELLSDQLCQPFDANRKGLNIGEAAGFALLEKKSDSHCAISLLGYGESSDAYHMSSPHPEGLGASRAMELALESASLKPQDIDYINLHGTATKINDATENRAIESVFGKRMCASSSKGWVGHTLGAAGITEAIISFLCLEHDFLPMNLNMTDIDAEMTLDILLDNVARPVNTILSNSFGFGGNNCALIFGKTK